MRRKIIILAVGVVVILAGGVLAFNSGSASKASAAAPASPPVPIVAGVVAQHDVPIYLTGIGTVIAYNTAIIHSQIQGQIASINFSEGQTVHAGDLLGSDRSASLPGSDRTIDREPRSRSGTAHKFARQSKPLRDARAEGLGYAAAPRHPEGTSLAIAECREVRSGTHRRCQRTTQLHASDVTVRWCDWHSSDRRG